MSIMRCNHPVLNVCLIAHRAFVHPNGQRTKEFYKTCFNDEDCTEKSCKDTDDIVKGRWCEIQCCNTSLCNSGVTPWAKKYMPRTMRQVGGGVGHVTCTSTNQIAIMLLVGLVFVFQLVSGNIIKHARDHQYMQKTSELDHKIVQR